MRGPGSDDTPGDPGDDRDRREGPSEDDEPGRNRTDDQEAGDAADRPDESHRGPDDRRTDDRDRRVRVGHADSSRFDDRERPGDQRVTIEDDGVFRWFLKTDDSTIVAIRDVITTVAIVVFVGMILFGISGVWPPLVAVESGSMEPNMERGDLIFVVDDGRFVGDDPAGETGVVTYENGVESGHEKFGNPGDVIIFTPDGQEFQTPIIHRAHYWVEEGENWVDTQANPEHLNGQSCDDIAACPASHDGFVTKGDNNDGYDQAGKGANLEHVVSEEWITGKASLRVPWLGHVRLTFDEIFASTAPGVAHATTTTPDSAVPGGPTAPQIGLFAIGSAAAIAGSRHSRSR